MRKHDGHTIIQIHTYNHTEGHLHAHVCMEAVYVNVPVRGEEHYGTPPSSANFTRACSPHSHMDNFMEQTSHSAAAAENRVRRYMEKIFTTHTHFPFILIQVGAGHTHTHTPNLCNSAPALCNCRAVESLHPATPPLNQRLLEVMHKALFFLLVLFH